MRRGWVIWRNEYQALHVVPHGEDHTLNTGCWCDPDYDDGIWIHHSLDGREVREENENQVET